MNEMAKDGHVGKWEQLGETLGMVWTGFKLNFGTSTKQAYSNRRGLLDDNSMV